METRILIIEDEVLIREQLAEIHWQDAGASLSGIFGDTQSAWEFAKRTHPDILITDIQLNGENGLDFANKLKSRLPKLKIIVLTAHNIVEYTKNAIDIGVMAYLLKPIDEEQLLSTVRTAVDIIEKDRQDIILNKIANSFTEKKYLLKGYFLSACSNNHYIDELHTLFGLPDNDGLCSTIVVQIYDNDDIFQDFINIKTLLETSEQYFLVPFYEPGLLVFFVRFKFSLSMKTALQECINTADRIKNYLDFNHTDQGPTYSIGIGAIINSYSDFDSSYKTAVDCLEHSFYIGKNQVIYCQDVEPSSKIVTYKEYINSCILSLKIGNEEDALKNIEILFESFKLNTVSIEIVQRICLEFIVNISTALIQIGHDPNYLFNKFDIWSYLKECTTLDALKLLITNLVTASIAQISDIRSSKISEMITEITDYINRNYTQTISLDDVAGKFFVSTCYLSTIFKQETGMNFKEYVRMLKINKAKELLTETNESIQEIANKLGYGSSAYFSTAFRNETGYIPSKYRLNAKQS